MRKELKKNDSLEIKRQRFDVAVGAFKTLLRRRGLYDSFFEAWNYNNWRKINTPSNVAWESWAKGVEIENWVSEAFVWESTRIPSSVWRALNFDWFEYYSKTFVVELLNL